MKNELRKLNRKDLLEIILEQTKRIEILEKDIDKLNKELDSKKISINESGSIAEAALKISDIFKACENAKEIYMDNVKELAIKEANVIKEKIISETNKRCREEERLFNKGLREKVHE